MAITHPTASTRNALADLVVDLLNNGTLEFQTSGGTEVATLGFGATAFGSASGGTATANAISDDTSATGGAVARFQLKTSGAVPIVQGTAGTSGTDIILSSTSIGAGDTVSCSSLTYSAPA